VKSRLFKIVIAAEFEEDIDHHDVNDIIMMALRTPGIPSGRAKVVTSPIDTLTCEPIPVNVPSHLLN
jgi:hypothetical protein